MKKFLSMLCILCATALPALAMEPVVSPISEIVIQNEKEPKIYTNSWEGEKISIQFRLTWIGYHIRLTNNTDSPMMLMWDKSAFVDADGNSHRVMPGETRVIHAAQAIPDTMIPPHASYVTLAAAEGYEIEDAYNHTMILEYPLSYGLFGANGLVSKKSKAYAEFAQKYKGKTISLIFCINQDGQDEYYKFDSPLEFDKALENIPHYDESGKLVVQQETSGIEIDQFTITKIKENSAAEKAGMQAGDIISEINAKPVSEIQDLSNYIETRFSQGRSIMILCIRDEEKVMITLKKTSSSNQ